MTLGKASLMTMGFVASLGVGVWIAPYVTDAKVRDVEPIAAAAPVRDAATAPAPVTRSTTATRETTARLASVPPTAQADEIRVDEGSRSRTRRHRLRKR
jgi:hypothetical protein